MSRTEGPWKWFNYPDGRKLLAGPERAVIHCPDAPMTVDAQDQAVLAAAPDLFRELKELAELAHNVVTVPDSVWAAIAKAEGR